MSDKKRGDLYLEDLRSQHEWYVLCKMHLVITHCRLALKFD